MIKLNLVPEKSKSILQCLDNTRLWATKLNFPSEFKCACSYLKSVCGVGEQIDGHYVARLKRCRLRSIVPDAVSVRSESVATFGEVRLWVLNLPNLLFEKVGKFLLTEFDPHGLCHLG